MSTIAPPRGDTPVSFEDVSHLLSSDEAAWYDRITHLANMGDEAAIRALDAYEQKITSYYQDDAIAEREFATLEEVPAW
jgi:hypothetical protein